MIGTSFILTICSTTGAVLSVFGVARLYTNINAAFAQIASGQDSAKSEASIPAKTSTIEQYQGPIIGSLRFIALGLAIGAIPQFFSLWCAIFSPFSS